jgi:HK97 family phage portal protein
MGDLVKTEDRGLWGLLVDRVKRFLVPAPTPTRTPGAMSATAVAQRYPPIRALSTIATFGWVRACAQARAGDMASVPLVASMGTGRRSEPLPDHPFLDLMRNPHLRMTEKRFRREIYLDWLMTGNAYLWLERDGTGRALNLWRLHPQQTEPLIDQVNQIQIGWQYNGGRWGSAIRRLSMDEVYHVADLSWQDDDQCVLGESRIRSINQDLAAERSSKEMARKTASRGRPDLILTSRHPDDVYSNEQIKSFRDEVEANFREGRPALFVGLPLEVKPVTWSPLDLQHTESLAQTRALTLAVMGVPPVRAGLDAADYNTSLAQLRIYWSQNQSDCGLFDEVFTQIAVAISGQTRVQIAHDFTHVEAFQAAYDRRQQRATIWVGSMGADPADAAAFEGFRDAPVGEATGRIPRRPGESREGEAQAPAETASLLARYSLAASYRWQQLREAAPPAEGWTLAARNERVRLRDLLIEHGVRSDAAELHANKVVGMQAEVARYGDGPVGARAFGLSWLQQVARDIRRAA